MDKYVCGQCLDDEFIQDLPVKLAKPSSVKDKPAAIEKTKKSVVLIVGFNDIPAFAVGDKPQ
jgi:hypothetical protein